MYISCLLFAKSIATLFFCVIKKILRGLIYILMLYDLKIKDLRCLIYISMLYDLYFNVINKNYSNFHVEKLVKFKKPI